MAKSGGDYGELMAILMQEGLLTEKQVKHAARVGSKLVNPKPLLDIVKELEYVTDEQIWGAIRKHKVSMRLGALLVELGLIGQEDLESAFSIQKKEGAGKKLGEILISHHFIKEQKLLEVLSLQLGHPFVEPRFTKVDMSLLDMVPKSLRDKHVFLPISRLEDGKVLTAFVDPMDIDDIEDASSIFSDGIKAALAAKDSIKEVVQRYEKGAKTSTVAADDETAIGIVETMIRSAAEVGASDIHIEPQDDRLRIRFRRDGVLETYKELPLELAKSMTSRLKIMSQADITEKRRHQGGRILFDHPGGQLDLRASFYVTIYGESIVLRLLNRQGSLIDIKDLGMYPKMRKKFIDSALNKPSGVLIITGPTGSGKTTTVYSCINHINDPQISIITAEEPVEYVVPGISQCSIDPKINLTFDETLRHIVRQDPDIIVIGEIRDNYSAEVAVQAALTGHKVLTTFHTEDSIGGLIRLLNMDIEAFLISSTVVSVLAQRLLRKVCTQCGQPYKPGPAELQLMGYTQKDVAQTRFMKGAGCAACRYTGYDGRIAVFELLILDEYVRSAILDKKTSFEIRKIGMETAGMATLFEEGVLKAAQGVTTLSEVFRCLPQVQRPRKLQEIKRILGA